MKEIFRRIIKYKNRFNTFRYLSHEVIWAHTFHDAIRNKPWLNDFQLNVGRMAANYSYLFLIVRILHDFKPNGVLELGLGESSKVITRILEHNDSKNLHIIIEQNHDWIQFFLSQFELSNKSTIIHLETKPKNLNGVTYEGYQNLEQVLDQKFECIFADAPLGTQYYSRFDLFDIVNRYEKSDDFIVVLDDAHRYGELQTIKAIKKMLSSKNIKFYYKEYVGLKTQSVFATEKYKFTTSL